MVGWFGIVVTSFIRDESSHEQSYSMLSLVSTGMGDHLWVGVPSQHVTKPTRSTQPCIPPGSLNRVSVPALIGWGKSGNVTYVTLWSQIPYGTSVPVVVRNAANCYTSLFTFLHILWQCMWCRSHKNHTSRHADDILPFTSTMTALPSYMEIFAQQPWTL